MSGKIMLAGGAEFGGLMAAPDKRALQFAGGRGAAVVIIPTAAAPDNNHRRAGQNGVRWFKFIGARDVKVVDVIDRESADLRDNVVLIENADLIYLLGGFTHYLGQTLRGSKSAAALLAAHAAGAVVAGSSAGAMVLCDHYYDPPQQRTEPGLGLVPNACVLPHHDTFGQRWAATLRRLLPDVALIGIDERTGMIDEGQDGAWHVYGKGGVTLYDTAHPEGHRPEPPFLIDIHQQP